MDNQSRIALVRLGNAFPDDSTPAGKYHLGDYLGSSSVVIDAAGDLINREEYAPYGETSFGTFTRKRYRFAGKERDEDNGLYYHGARYYAPWLARWISCDPIGWKDNLNLYAFAKNNPARYVDPSGRESVKPQAEIGDIKPQSKQGAAIRAGGVRISENEHIRARINLVLQTTDPETGTSAYGRSNYRASATLTIPEDMARVKTVMDLNLRDQLKAALKTGVINEDLVKEMTLQADIERTIAARNQTMGARLVEGKPVNDLVAITDEKIIEAAHLQQSELFHGGRAQKPLPQDTAPAEVERAIESRLPSDSAKFRAGARATQGGSVSVKLLSDPIKFVVSLFLAHAGTAVTLGQANTHEEVASEGAKLLVANAAARCAVALAGGAAPAAGIFGGAAVMTAIFAPLRAKWEAAMNQNTRYYSYQSDMRP